MKDRWEARPFLAGSPAQWGWNVDEEAEAAALVHALAEAISASIFDGEDEDAEPNLSNVSTPRCMRPSCFSHMCSIGTRSRTYRHHSPR